MQLSVDDDNNDDDDGDDNDDDDDDENDDDDDWDNDEQLHPHSSPIIEMHFEPTLHFAQCTATATAQKFTSLHIKPCTARAGIL